MVTLVLDSNPSAPFEAVLTRSAPPLTVMVPCALMALAEELLLLDVLPPGKPPIPPLEDEPREAPEVVAFSCGPSPPSVPMVSVPSVLTHLPPVPVIWIWKVPPSSSMSWSQVMPFAV